MVINAVIVLIILGNLLLLAGFVGLDYDISGVESNVVFTIQNILTDNSLLYVNPEQIPFTVTQYSPLYYLIADSMISILGIGAENDLAIRIAGRLMSIITCLIVAILFYNIAKRQIGVNSKVALVLSLGIITFPVPWYYLTRPDVLVALTYLLFISTILRYIDKAGFGKAVILGALTFMAISAKQSGIFLIGIGGLFFLYYRDFKGLLGAFTGFLLTGIIFSSLFIWAGYNGTYLLDNIVKGVDNGFSFRSFADHTLLAFGSMYGAYALGTAYIVFKIIKDKSLLDRKMHFMLSFAFFLFLFSTLTATKKGSSANYYHDFLIVTLLIWAYYLNHVTPQISQKWMNRAVLFLGLSVLLTAVVHVKTYTFVNFKKMTEYDNSLAEVNDLVNKELGDSYLYSNVRQVSLKHPGRVMMPQFDIAECCAYPRGIYNYDEFCKLMVSGKLKFLIFDSEAPQSQFGCDLGANYILYKRFGRYHVYINRGVTPNDTLSVTIHRFGNF